MKTTIIGTNGFLSNQIGKYCNREKIELDCCGKSLPKLHSCNNFEEIDLTQKKLEINTLLKSDVVIYVCGAGIQSNLKQSWDQIYRLNTFVPIEISCLLSEKNFKGTFVTFGSYFEIGNNEKNIKFDELDIIMSPYITPNYYCLSKRLLTRYVNSSFAKYNHLHIILPTIYGYGEAPHRIIPYTINALKNNLPIYFTSGHQIRQYLYAGDIPEIVFNLIKKKTTGIINIAGVESYSIRELVSIIYNHFGYVPNEDLFGKANREDVGMQNLQLDDKLLKTILPDIYYTSLKESLNCYDQ